jgi:hypothetical protein
MRPRDIGHIYPRYYTCGVDLGQAQDPTAIVVLETEVTKRVFEDRHSGWLDHTVERAEHRVRHAERLPLHLPYPDQVAHVRHLMIAPQLPKKDTELVIDMSGVGRPVFEMFERDGLKPIGVQITAGLEEVRNGAQVWNVAKVLLVSRLQAALHAGDLKFAVGLSEADAFRQDDVRGARGSARRPGAGAGGRAVARAAARARAGHPVCAAARGMTDQLERLKGLARLDWPADEVWLLLSTVSEAEWQRLRDLQRTWPPERGWPPPRHEIRRCLDR